MAKKEKIDKDAKLDEEKKVDETTEGAADETLEETTEESAEKDEKDEVSKKKEELNDRLMRTMAEFDNFRKRSEKEKAAMFEIGAKSIIEKILPVIDNFERGFDALPEEDKENAFVKGIEKVYKQLTTSLEEAGVSVIEAVGNEFDPNLHNAVMHEEDEEKDTNIVVEEFQKGYMYKESVVRHSMVKVVN